MNPMLFRFAMLMPLVLVFGCRLDGQPPKGEKPVSDDELGRHYEPAGGYSIVPPESWQVREVPGLKNRVIVGRSRNNFAPNINVVVEKFPGSLDAYAKANIAALEKMLSECRIVSQDDVELDSGQRTVKIVAENVQQGRQLGQTFYLVGPHDTKYVITCTSLLEDRQDLAQVFEKSARSFRFNGESSSS